MVGWLIPGNIFQSDSNDAFIFACLPVIYFYASLYLRANAEEKRPIAALLAIFASVILFWAVFKQNGTALTIWAENYTNREVHGTTGSLFNGVNLAENIAYQKDSVASYDAQFRIQKKDGVVLKEYGYPFYFMNVAPEKLPAEGGTATLWSLSLIYI